MTRTRRWLAGFGLVAVSVSSIALFQPFTMPPSDPQYAPACGPVPPCTVPPGQWDLLDVTRTSVPTSKPGGISVNRASYSGLPAVLGTVTLRL